MLEALACVTSLLRFPLVVQTEPCRKLGTLFCCCSKVLLLLLLLLLLRLAPGCPAGSFLFLQNNVGRLSSEVEVNVS